MCKSRPNSRAKCLETPRWWHRGFLDTRTESPHRAQKRIQEAYVYELQINLVIRPTAHESSQHTFRVVSRRKVRVLIQGNCRIVFRGRRHQGLRGRGYFEDTVNGNPPVLSFIPPIVAISNVAVPFANDVAEFTAVFGKPSPAPMRVQKGHLIHVYWHGKECVLLK